MKVLIACEESQAVTKEFRRLGHEAYSCDIIDQSGGHPEWHIRHDVIPLLDGNCLFETDDGAQHVIDGRWDMIIAFPPCTHLAVSGARHFETKRVDGRQREGIEFFCQFLTADCERIAIENPVGIISGDYIPTHFSDLAEKYDLPRKPSQIIQPYEFGDPHKKTTCLWLKGLPLLEPTNVVEPDLISYMCKDGKKVTFSKHMVHGFSNGDRAKHRSKTFQGIAKAMAEQWDSHVDISKEMIDLSDAPKEIKAEIIKNAELLNERDGEEETTEEEIMETKTNTEPTTAENVIGFNAVEQLKQLADERKALANLKPENTRFSDDVRAIEYAIGVMVAVGL